MNSRVLRIFKNEEVYFYGDYDLDIYIGTKHDYRSLGDVAAAVIQAGRGWIRNLKEPERSLTDRSLTSILSECGYVPTCELSKFLPRKGVGEAGDRLVRCDVYRKDGNFAMFACETQRYYYVICFATS
jgi:hypothetical protein